MMICSLIPVTCAAIVITGIAGSDDGSSQDPAGDGAEVFFVLFFLFIAFLMSVFLYPEGSIPPGLE